MLEMILLKPIAGNNRGRQQLDAFGSLLQYWRSAGVGITARTGSEEALPSRIRVEL